MAQTFTSQRRLSSAKVKEFSLISNFGLGYRNRENITKLPAGVLVVGSQNVLTNVDGGISIRKGYVLDGASSDTNFLLQQSLFYLEQEDGSLIIIS